MSSFSPFAAALKTHLENSNLTFSDIIPGEGDRILHARLPECRGIYGQPGRFVIRRENDMLIASVEKIGIFDNPVDNLIAESLTTDLIQVLATTNLCNVPLPRRLGQLMAVETYMARKRSVWDLLGTFVTRTNHALSRSKAVVDLSEGELYVVTCMDSDFETVPTSLETHLEGLTFHSSLLSNMIRIVRLNFTETGPTYRETDRDAHRMDRESYRSASPPASPPGRNEEHIAL